MQLSSNGGVQVIRELYGSLISPKWRHTMLQDSDLSAWRRSMFGRLASYEYLIETESTCLPAELTNILVAPEHGSFVV